MFQPINDKNSIVRRKSQHQIADVRPLKKSSSCSTIYLDDSTVSQPNLKNTVKCVALAIYYHIKNRDSQREIDIFDEKLHPLTRDGVTEDYDKHNPEHRQIYKFVRTLFNAAQLTAECAIITLVYLERLLTYADLDIQPSNWKRIVLGGFLRMRQMAVLSIARMRAPDASNCVLLQVRFCWRRRCGTTRPCGTWTTARSSKT